ncbi:MAG: hypothetical protein KDB07_03120 [Planctomycetes bacterium]|nr:hypothetical protein [Planctomycetota bacterium]
MTTTNEESNTPDLATLEEERRRVVTGLLAGFGLSLGLIVLMHALYFMFK